MGSFGIPNRQAPVKHYNMSFQEKVEAQQEKEAKALFGEENQESDEAQI